METLTLQAFKSSAIADREPKYCWQDINTKITNKDNISGNIFFMVFYTPFFLVNSLIKSTLFLFHRF